MSKYLREIKQHCTDLRAVLLDAQICTAEDIAPFWPGGEHNPDRRAFSSWRYTLFNLARFSARAEARQEYQIGVSPARSDALLALQAGEPRIVPLAHPITIADEDGAATIVTEFVLPHKCWTSLRVMSSMARIGVLLVQTAAPFYVDGTQAELLLEIDAWRERIEQSLVWAAVSPTSGLPWDPRAERWPTPPAWVGQLLTGDLIAVQTAWTEQHAQALVALAPFIKPDANEPDPLSGWETFFGSYASEKGLFVQQLMNDRAFVPFFTQVTIAADAARRAREKPKSTAPEPPVTG